MQRDVDSIPIGGVVEEIDNNPMFYQNHHGEEYVTVNCMQVILSKAC